MDKRTNNAARRTPPKKTKSDGKPSSKSSPTRALPLGSPKPTTTTHSSTANISSKQEMKSPQVILPGFDIPATSDLSFPTGIEVDHDTDDFDISAFADNFRDNLRKEQEERRKKGSYVETFWFFCCMCEHPLQSQQTICSKCPQECCDDCHAKREIPDRGNPDRDEPFKLKIRGRLVNDDTNTEEMGSNEPESSLRREALKVAVEHALQNLWKALDRWETVERKQYADLRKQLKEVHPTLAKLMTWSKEEWSDSHKAMSSKALCDLRDGIEATVIPFWTTSQELKFRFFTFWARLHGRGPRLDEEACTDAYRKCMDRGTETLIETLEETSWIIGMATKMVGTSEYPHMLTLLCMRAEKLERCNISAIDNGAAYYPTLENNLLSTLRIIKPLVPPSVSIPHPSVDHNTPHAPSISLSWPEHTNSYEKHDESKSA